MDRETLCESLILWVETFNLEVKHNTIEGLSDGIAMSKVLHEIAPDYFNEGWMNKIKHENQMNWRLKVSNLKKILKGILEYNLEILGIQIHDFQMPDVNAIGEHCDKGELGRLLQLILGCAVNCTEKQEYIQRIMAMEESVQHVVMTAIQELMTKEIASGVDSEVGEQLKRTVEELNGALEAKEELMQRCHELDLQVNSLLEEKQNLQFETERLSERLNQAENLDDPEFTMGGNTPAGKRFQQIQHQLDTLQEENYKLESAKDDFRIKVEVLQKEVNDLKEKNSDLFSLADECRGLKDELDILRHTSEQVVKYEVQIESYKRKMDELSDLHGQVKILEDKNTEYMQENLKLQEEIRRSATLKQQLDVYKRQGHEQQSKLTEETKRADKAEFEAKRMQEKVGTLQREKERLVTDRDTLQEINDELKLTQAHQLGGSVADSLSTSPNLAMLSLPPEIREKLLRLEHENKMLKVKTSGDSEESMQVIQDMLDVANSRKNELETELRLANQKTMELEAQIEDMQEMAKTTVSSTELSELRKKLDEQVHLTQQKDKIIQNERENVTEVQKELTSRNAEIEKLHETIELKEEEKRTLQEKYKKYFDKARSVICTQEQKLKSSGNYYPDLQALKQQIQEKDRYIEQLQKDQEKTKNTFEQEEKMMVSAWYNLGIQLHRQAAIDRLENSQGQAFLSRQRQVHLRGQQRIPNSHPNSSSEVDLCLDPPSNQTTVGDGCFSSLFECVLTRLQADVGAGYDLSVPSNSEKTETLRPSHIQTHLIAGLLGTKIENCTDIDLELHGNQCPKQNDSEETVNDVVTERSSLINEMETPSKNPDREIRYTNLGCNKREFNESIPETPVSKPRKKQIKLSLGPNYSLFDDELEVESVAYNMDDMSSCDMGVSSTDGAQSDIVNTEDVLINPVIVQKQGDAKGNGTVDITEENVCGQGNESLDNFFNVLDEFSDLDKSNSSQNNIRSNASFFRLLGLVDEEQKGPSENNHAEPMEYVPDSDDNQSEALSDVDQNKAEPPQILVVLHKDSSHDKIMMDGIGNSDSRLAKYQPTSNTNQLFLQGNLSQTITPLKPENKNHLTHEKSPFVKKMNTDKVTKRRSRRKNTTSNAEDEEEAMLTWEDKENSAITSETTFD